MPSVIVQVPAPEQRSGKPMKSQRWCAEGVHLFVYGFTHRSRAAPGDSSQTENHDVWILEVVVICSGQQAKRRVRQSHSHSRQIPAMMTLRNTSQDPRPEFKSSSSRVFVPTAYNYAAIQILIYYLSIQLLLCFACAIVIKDELKLSRCFSALLLEWMTGPGRPRSTRVCGSNVMYVIQFLCIFVS